MLALAACSSDALKPNPTPPNYGGMGTGTPGDLSLTSRLGGDDSGTLFTFGGKGKSKDAGDGSGGGGSGPGLGVNAYLWRGALDTIGFMPLVSADPFGGVIITDWYSPPGVTGERFKAAVYILSRDLRSDGIRLNINRQVLQNGQWVSGEMSPSTVLDIENKVLARARLMREQARSGNG
jgi:hypothetical protein